MTELTDQGYHRVHISKSLPPVVLGHTRPRWLWLASTNVEIEVDYKELELHEIHFVVYINSHNVWRRINVSFSKSEPPEGSFEEDIMEETGGHVMGRSVYIYNTIKGHLNRMPLCNDPKVTRLILATDPSGKLWCDVSQEIDSNRQYPKVSSEESQQLFESRLIPESSMQFLDYVDSDIIRKERSQWWEDAWVRMKQGIYYVKLEGVVYIKIDLKDEDSIRQFLDDTLRDQQAGIVEALAINPEATHIKSRLVRTDVTMAYFSRKRRTALSSRRHA